jgi:hypothetical protein
VSKNKYIKGFPMKELQQLIDGHIPKHICFSFSHVLFLYWCLLLDWSSRHSQVSSVSIMVGTVTCLEKKDGERNWMDGFPIHLINLS